MLRVVVSVFAFAVAAGHAPTARAEEPPKEAEAKEAALERARALVVRADKLQSRGDQKNAIEAYREALAIFDRHGEKTAAVASALNELGSVLYRLGRYRQAMSVFEQALAMRRRLFAGDHPDVAVSLNNMAAIYGALGRPADALPFHEEALAIRRRLFVGDHPHIALSLNNLATAYGALGRSADALPVHEEALAMYRRLFAGDHPDIAQSLSNLATAYDALGRPADALPVYEEALAMRRGLFDGDHPLIARSLNNLAHTYGALGRPADALSIHEEALAMYRRLFDGDHPDIARSLNNLASTYDALGRPADALRVHEEALPMYRRLLEGDHPDIALSLNNLAQAYGTLGRSADALRVHEEALAVRRRLFAGDHPDIAQSLNNLAYTYAALGRPTDAVAMWREAAAMARRIGWPELHFPVVGLARRALAEGDAKAATPLLDEAIGHLEARRAEARSLASEGAARYAAELRSSDPFPLMVRAQVELGRPAAALGYVERTRARAMLDLLARGRTDPLAQAAARARREGDEEALERIEAAGKEVAGAEALLVRRGKEVERARAGGKRKELRAALDAENEARRELQKALRRRLHVVRDTLPEARSRPAGEIQGLLAPGERLLAYALGSRSYLFLVAPERIEVFALEKVSAKEVAAYADAISRPRAKPTKALFEKLVPRKVWAEILKATRVYVLPHGALHRLPFEALATGAGRYWVDDGPPLAYVASGSVLAWLRAQRKTHEELSLVAVGDPDFGDAAPAWPEKGVLVRSVMPDGQAAGLGLRAGDVITSWGGRAVTDAASLRAAAQAAEGETVPIRFVRDGKTHAVAAKPGPLGVRIALEPPPVAGPKLLAGGEVATRIRSVTSRSERLVPLPGTRREVEAIAKAFRAADPEARITTLLGADAREARLLEAAKGARFLHLATHGLIDETKSASFSALALARPRVPVPGDDGLLTLADLLGRWRGRLSGTELVVLSACESQRGKLEADEGMLALPWGFHFAGCPSVVGSHWKVDDQSTAQLMAAFYERLLASGGRDKARALLEARKKTRKTHPDPYHWGAFVFLGDPR